MMMFLLNKFPQATATLFPATQISFQTGLHILIVTFTNSRREAYEENCSKCSSTLKEKMREEKFVTASFEAYSETSMDTGYWKMIDAGTVV
jgi:hypothetical protein